MSARDQLGYAIFAGPNGQVEIETFTCAHCGALKGIEGRVESKTCFPCFKTICADCAKTGKCDPTERRVERLERAIDSARSRDDFFASVLR